LPFADDPYPFPNVNATSDAKALANVLKSTLTSNVQSILPKKYPIVSAGQRADPVMVPFSMLLVAGPAGSHVYAGVNDDSMCFSASLLKVAVMYAAMELFAGANRVAPKVSVSSGETPTDALLSALGSAFDKGLAGGPTRKLNAVTPNTPAWEDIFEMDLGPPQTAKFVQAFSSDLDLMVRLSDDDAAARCIDKMGFAYINVALANGGFFHHGGPADDHGIWITGDYAALEIIPRPVQTVNDGGGKLVMNTAAMLKMFALILGGSLVDATSCHEMQLALIAAKSALVPLIIHADDPANTTPVTVPFAVLMSKYGYDKIGRPGHWGDTVYSECSVLQWSASDTDTINALKAMKLSDTLIICWQNFRQQRFKSFDKIRQIVINTVTQFVA